MENNDSKESEVPSKKGRHRKKQLYNSILKQMEFYFSDSNLSKDRFLGQLIKENPYIELSVFLKFNKIRKLTSSLEDLQKALNLSNLLQLSEDKSSVTRIDPVKEKSNVDECTVYVERLKSDANHEWLSSIFSEFGKVTYVSIPKFKHNNVIKGFAFVEFENESESEKALKFFDSIGCKMPGNTEPEQLCSIATFDSNENEKEGKNVKITIKEECQDIAHEGENVKVKIKDEYQDIGENVKVEIEDECQDIEQGEENNPKRKHKEEKNGENVKKIKTDVESQDIEQAEDNTQKRKHEEENEEKNVKKIKTEDQSQDIEQGEENTHKRKHEEEKEGEDAKKVKIEDASKNGDDEQKRKKKLKKENKRKNFIKELGLQVLSKKEWKKMRNRYLDLQRKKMKEFKVHLQRAKLSQPNYQEKHKKQNEVKENKAKSQEEEKYEFVEGLIVKIKLSETVADVKKTKNDLRSSCSDIEYVDIPNVGCEDVYLRFNSAKSANNFCTQESAFKKALLTGEEEKAYWLKIKHDREQKFEKSKKKQRGRDKLLKKANHTKFDD